MGDVQVRFNVRQKWRQDDSGHKVQIENNRQNNQGTEL